MRRHVVFLDDEAARNTTTCERALLNQMGGGCQVPIGALAEVVNGRLYLEAVVARPDGTKVLRESGDGDDPVKLGEAVGEALLRQGGDAILREVYGKAVATPAATMSFEFCVCMCGRGRLARADRITNPGNEIDLKIRNGGTALRGSSVWSAGRGIRRVRCPPDCATRVRKFWRFPLSKSASPGLTKLWMPR